MLAIKSATSLGTESLLLKPKEKTALLLVATRRIHFSIQSNESLYKYYRYRLLLLSLIER